MSIILGVLTSCDGIPQNGAQIISGKGSDTLKIPTQEGSIIESINNVGNSVSIKYKNITSNSSFTKEYFKTAFMSKSGDQYVIKF